MTSSTKTSLANFEKALSKLEEFLETPVTEDRDKAGIIQAFEFTFETCWKTIQKAVIEHNKTVGSPKQAFQAAFELGWIREAQQHSWIVMAEDRNLTSHTYRESLANEILSRIRTMHLANFRDIKHKVSLSG